MIDSTTQPDQQESQAMPETLMPRNVSRHYEALYWRMQDARSVSNLPYAVGITSCQPGEGVSTVAANLAITAARADSQTVILVEASVGRRSVARRFGLPDAPGLQDALRDASRLDECIQQTVHENFAIMPAGTRPDQQILDCEPYRFAALIDELKQSYCTIIVDLPTADDLSPCYRMAGKLDGVLLVVEPGRTSSNAASRVKNQLQEYNAELIGAILNKDR